MFKHFCLPAASIANGAAAGDSTTILWHARADKSQMFKSLYQGNYISGGTFNVHVLTSASTGTMVNESPQRKKFRRLRVLDSQESSQEL